MDLRIEILLHKVSALYTLSSASMSEPLTR